MINEFLNYLRYQKKYSAHTVAAYECDLNQFCLYLQNNYAELPPEQATHYHIRSWLVELMNHNVSGKTINRKISSLRTFYKFLLKKGKITVSPLKKVIAPKIPKKLPEFVDHKSMERLFEDIEFDAGFPGQRDRMILELLYATGMRRAELINLKEADVSLQQGTLKVLGKGNKERIIPITKELAAAVQNYLGIKNKAFPQPGHDFLLVTDKGEKLYPALVYRVVKKFLSLITTIDKKSPHILRHTFATHLSNGGADLNAIKELLGHANLAATQIYTHNTIEKLKEIFKQAHPKA